MDAAAARLLLQRALQGVEYLHACGIVHADLKPANILVDGSGMPRLTDFETSRAADATAATATFSKGGGSMGFIAPELHDCSAESTRPSDMFAFGKTLEKARIAMTALPDGHGGDALSDLIEQLVAADADARLTASQALQHRYFTTDAAEEEKKLRSAAEAQAEEVCLQREQLDGRLQDVHDEKRVLLRKTAEHRALCAETERKQREDCAAVQRQVRELQAGTEVNELEAQRLQTQQGELAAAQSTARDTQAASEQNLQEERRALATKEAELKRLMVAVGRYEWLDEHSEWKPYPPDVNKEIHTAASSGADCSFTHGNFTYSVTTRFPMFQRNDTHANHTCRHVRLSGGPTDEKYMRETPVYWKPGTKSTETADQAPLQLLTPKTCSDMKDAYDEVVALVTREDKCKRELEILSVSVLQDPTKWKAYNLKKAHLEAKLGGDANEKRLFHAGSEDSIRSIARMGFIREFNKAGRSAYGKGTYFARDMSYSANDSYSVPNASSEKFAFVARVLVGDPCEGKLNQPRPATKANGTLHDSMVNNLANPTEFVMSSGADDHVYPEFIVKFKKKA
jgi:poly [ADP-ribose] polymerase 10/14/15